MRGEKGTIKGGLEIVAVYASVAHTQIALLHVNPARVAIQ